MILGESENVYRIDNQTVEKGSSILYPQFIFRNKLLTTVIYCYILNITAKN